MFRRLGYGAWRRECGVGLGQMGAVSGCCLGRVVGRTDGVFCRPRGIGCRGHWLGGEKAVQKSNGLAFIVAQVFVGVVKSHNHVAAFAQVVQGEIAFLVGACGIHGLHLGNNAVAQSVGHLAFAIGHNGNHLGKRFERERIQHLAAQSHAVYAAARREYIFKAGQGVALVEVNYAFLELKEVGGVGHEGVLQLHNHTAPLGGIFRLGIHGRGNQNVVFRILDVDIFVERDAELFLAEVQRAVGRSSGKHHRGLFVLGSA